MFKFNQYTLIARVFPAALTAIPFVILSSFIISPDVVGLFKNFEWFKDLSLSAIFIYAFSQLNRYIAKEAFEKRIFKGELEMPTTSFLLWSNGEYSMQFKTSVRQHILQDFKLTLPSEAEEAHNTTDARRKIVEAVQLVRNKVGDGRLLLQHNVEYGFVRNLIGGCPLSLICTIVNLVWVVAVQRSEVAYWMSLGFGIGYFALLCFGRPLIVKYGHIYARRLFQEYMS